MNEAESASPNSMMQVVGHNEFLLLASLRKIEDESDGQKMQLLRLEDSTATMKHERFEIEPRPAAVGGGWRLRLIGRDLETGGEIELGGGVFPVDPAKTKGTPTPTPCKPAKNGWMMMLQTLNLCPITE